MATSFTPGTSRPRPAQREKREARHRVRGVVAGQSAHVGRRDDRADLATTEGEGALEERPPDSPGLAAGQDEELRELEEPTPLDRPGRSR